MWGTPWVLVILSILNKKLDFKWTWKTTTSYLLDEETETKKNYKLSKATRDQWSSQPILVFHFQSEEWPFWFKTSKASVSVYIPAPGQERGKGDDLDFWCRLLNNRQQLVNSNLLLYWSDLSARMEMKSCTLNQLLNGVVLPKSNIDQFDPESSKVLLKNESSTS